jgi:hypothetical protein
MKVSVGSHFFEILKIPSSELERLVHKTYGYRYAFKFPVVLCLRKELKCLKIAKVVNVLQKLAPYRMSLYAGIKKISRRGRALCASAVYLLSVTPGHYICNSLSIRLSFLISNYRTLHIVRCAGELNIFVLFLLRLIYQNCSQFTWS